MMLPINKATARLAMLYNLVGVLFVGCSRPGLERWVMVGAGALLGGVAAKEAVDVFRRRNRQDGLDTPAQGLIAYRPVYAGLVWLQVTSGINLHQEGHTILAAGEIGSAVLVTIVILGAFGRTSPKEQDES